MNSQIFSSSIITLLTIASIFVISISTISLTLPDFVVRPVIQAVKSLPDCVAISPFNADSLNIVVYTANMNPIDAEEFIIELFGKNGENFFAVPPFDRHKQDITIWWITRSFGDLEQLPSLISFYCNIPNKISVFLIPGNNTPYFQENKKFGYIVLGNINATQSGKNYRPALFHELGHVFGLAEEYINGNVAITKNAPNCVASKEVAIQSWGGYLNSDEGNCQIGVFTGCGGHSDWYRPTNNSVMNNLRKDLHPYCPVNEAHIDKWLKEKRKKP